MQANPFAIVPEVMEVTTKAAEFIENVQFKDIPEEAVRIGIRCILDGMGLIVAGTDEHSVRILVEDALEQGGKEDALLLGCGDKKVPVAIAARVLGTAAHAHDWDDS